MNTADPAQPHTTSWHHGVTRYEWMVLAIASVGWIFDVFEGQLFNITRGQMLPEILGVAATDPVVKGYGDQALAYFLVGGTVGGLLFGMLADRIGRRPAMVFTILMYSVFSGLTYFAQSWWQVAALRFLVAMGVGGEWAVAAALVAEVFPTHARAHASGIFHASSVFGVWGATLAGFAVGAQWRYAYLIGVAPALLVLWVRASLGESHRWMQMSTVTVEPSEGASQPAVAAHDRGNLKALLLDSRWRWRALLGMGLSAVGLAAYWAVTVAGQDLAQDHLMRSGIPRDQAAGTAKLAYGFLLNTGSGIGLLLFGPLCVRIGRRRAFTIWHLAALAIVPAICYLPQTYAQLAAMLPLLGFCNVGMHAGYAIWFPELFPTRLRATGTSFCFNVGRIVAAPMLFISGALKSRPGVDLRETVSWLSLLFAIGLVFVFFLPETKGQPLPE